MSVQSLSIALEREMERIELLDDPITAARQVRSLRRVLDRARKGVRLIERTAVLNMREEFGFSWNDCARELGVTKARAQQIGWG